MLHLLYSEGSIIGAIAIGYNVSPINPTNPDTNAAYRQPLKNPLFDIIYTNLQ